MRILHLIYSHLDNPWLCGGAPLRCHEINRRLAQRHEITVLCGAWPNAPREREIDGVRYIHAGSGRSYVLSRLSYTVEAAKACRRLDADLVVEDVSGFAPVFAGVRPRRPTVALVHHVASRHILRSHGVRGLACLAYEAAVLRSHAHFIAVSESTKASIEARVSAAANIAIVHNGIDSDLLDLESTDEGYFLLLGRHEPYMKGLDLLFEAMQEVEHTGLDLRVVVAGYGDQGRTLRLAGRARLNGRVQVMGEVSEDEKRRLLSNCMAVVMPSRFEGWGIVAIEAGACGKPVIGTRVPGLVDSVRDGETGILVPPEDTDALADAICRVAEDGELRHRLGAAGRAWAKNFSWDRAAEEQERFYQEVVEAEA